jgi:hypothetical protein
MNKGLRRPAKGGGERLTLNVKKAVFLTFYFLRSLQLCWADLMNKEFDFARNKNFRRLQGENQIIFGNI